MKASTPTISVLWVLAAGDARFDDGRRFALARYDLEGALDGSFDGDGRVVTDFPETAGILLAGRAFVAGWNFAVARYLADGSLDPTFGGDGRVLTDLASRNEMAHDIAYDHRPLSDRLACAVGEAEG